MSFINYSETCGIEDCPPLKVAAIVCRILEFAGVTIRVSDEEIHGRNAHKFEVDPPEARMAVDFLTDAILNRIDEVNFSDTIGSA